MRRLNYSALFLLALASSAYADEDRDNLQAMHMLKASGAVCGFEMSESEAARLAKASAFLERKLKYDAARAKAFYDEVAGAFEAQKADLCDANGEWRKTYASALAGLPD
jgi:aryl-alcohol dehydrogenase-like predicted oxidoreductase